MKKILLMTMALVLLSLAAYAIDIAPGGTVSESFSIGTTQTAPLPTGWKADKNTTVRTVGSYSAAVSATEQYAGNTMSTSATGGIYNYGAGVYNTATDRAIGWISSSSTAKSGNLYVQLTNSGVSAISNFTISYKVEKYRGGTNAAGFSIQMYYSTNGTSWTSAGSDFLTSFAADATNNGFASAPGATTNVTSKTLSQTLAASSSIYLAWNYAVTSGSTTSNAQGLGIDDVIIVANTASTPLITKSGTLSAFSTSQGTPSTYQTYTIAGANLTANILCIPPTGYEISTSAGSGYTTGTLTLTQSGGTVAETTIYARLTGATAGTPSGTITHNSTGAAEVPVSVTGTVYKAEPSNHVTGFEAITADPPYSSVYMTWTDATGTTVPDGYLIKGSAISLGSIVDPVDGTFEEDSALVQNVVAGVEEAMFENLASNATYYFKVYPYTNSGINTNFKTDGTVANTSVLTEYGPPDTPTAIAATAISHDGFTARWDTVGGATSYRLDVLTGTAAIATDLFISEYVEGGSNRKAIEIFNGTGSAVDLSGYTLKKQTNGAGAFGNDLVLSGTLNNNDVYVVVYSSATGSLKDEAYVDLATTSSAMSFNGNDCVALYHGLAQIDVVGVVDQVTPSWGADVTLVRNANNSSPSVSWTLDDWTSYSIDTVDYLGSHTMSNSLSPVAGYNDLTVTGNLKRVSGLNASTDYSYRVRAYNAIGLSANSNAIVLTTTALTAGVTANTIVGGASTAFTVPVVGAYTNLGVEIDPDTITSDDFSVTVAEIATGLTYTISTTNNLALNGVYILNHAGMSSAPTLTSNIGTLEVNASEASGSIVTISGIPAVKGELIITAEDGGTLPVELSSFTAIISTQNFVRLMWVTESETNVNGYYIYRGITDNFDEALLVSDMIPATNTSQQTSYSYLDQELYTDGLYYYWLQSADIDGSSQIHGPITALVNLNGGNTTPILPLVTELQSVYPNPFNPSTFIRFAIASPAHVQINIYNVRGQIVRSLVNADKAVGNHRIEWNGKDDNGSNCSNGIYYIRMNAGKDSFLRKAVMLK